jgi:hypothetical protein
VEKTIGTNTMTDETKKEDYYREQWAKIQVEKHNASKPVGILFWVFRIYFTLIILALLGNIVFFGQTFLIWTIQWLLNYL